MARFLLETQRGQFTVYAVDGHVLLVTRMYSLAHRAALAEIRRAMAVSQGLTA
jgi:endonuclease III